MGKAKATARVTVKLEITLTQPWPEESTIKEIEKRASEEAKNIITQRIAALGNIKMIQKAVVDVIIFKGK